MSASGREFKHVVGWVSASSSVLSRNRGESEERRARSTRESDCEDLEGG
jgi:hypothetical protein